MSGTDETGPAGHESRAHHLESVIAGEAERVWQAATEPNPCPVCHADRVPCPNPDCFEAGDHCPVCHGRHVLCRNCDAAAWQAHLNQIEKATNEAARIVSAEDNGISMI